MQTEDAKHAEFYRHMRSLMCRPDLDGIVAGLDALEAALEAVIGEEQATPELVDQAFALAIERAAAQ